jgi:hypothetical protein
MPISIADRSRIAAAVEDLIRAIDSLISEGRSPAIGNRLQQTRTDLLALLSPSGEQAHLTGISDILDSQYSLSEKEALYELWESLRPGLVWLFTLPRTPQLALVKFERILAKLKADSSDADSDQVEAVQIQAIPRARGRKQAYDPQKDQEIAEEWQRARDRGVPKKAFVKDLRPKHSLLELNRLLNRVRKSQSRAD